MTRYVCIHGHFYQPPRENPFTYAVARQPSAKPAHDWNERITGECYRPNAWARILDGRDFIRRVVCNYAHVSFNFGATLLEWMEREANETYRAILAADRDARTRFSGHGSAIAQVYHHAIAPLLPRRDKETQVRWGISDFERRFGRAPEGMWLAETAVDLETLDVLAAAGIRFTILAPRQARATRRTGESAWRPVEDGSIDPRVAYRQRLPSGRTIALFFYDGPISQAIAFERLLDRGEELVERLTGAFGSKGGRAELVHVATDGETYGHHHRFGEMALADALERLERRGDVRTTNYAEFLERHPPEDEVEIVENSSWSCAHGVERWRSNCGCSGGTPGYTQEWRAPLRNALVFLQNEIDDRFEREGRTTFRDPWAARNDYVELFADPAGDARDRFFARHGIPGAGDDQRRRGLRLLEMQRQALAMFTSCGWFFDDLAGIETVQVIAHAARAMQLAGWCFGPGLEAPFLERLAVARSNDPERGTGRDIFEREVRPLVVDDEAVAAHHAVFGLEGVAAARALFPTFDVDVTSERRTSRNGVDLYEAALRVQEKTTEEDSTWLVQFERGPGGGTRGRALLDRGGATAPRTEPIEAGGPATWTLARLLADARALVHQRRVAELERDAIAAAREWMDAVERLSNLDGKSDLPHVLNHLGQSIVEARLGEALAADVVDPVEVRSRVIAVVEAKISVSAATRRRLAEALDREIDVVEVRSDAPAFARLRLLLESTAPIDPNAGLWRAQNVCWKLLKDARTAEHARDLVRTEEFKSVARFCRVAIDGAANRA